MNATYLQVTFDQTKISLLQSHISSITHSYKDWATRRLTKRSLQAFKTLLNFTRISEKGSQNIPNMGEVPLKEGDTNRRAAQRSISPSFPFTVISKWRPDTSTHQSLQTPQTLIFVRPLGKKIATCRRKK